MSTFLKNLVLLLITNPCRILHQLPFSRVNRSTTSTIQSFKIERNSWSSHFRLNCLDRGNWKGYVNDVEFQPEAGPRLDEERRRSWSPLNDKNRAKFHSTAENSEAISKQPRRPRFCAPLRGASRLNATLFNAPGIPGPLPPGQLQLRQRAKEFTRKFHENSFAWNYLVFPCSGVAWLQGSYVNSEGIVSWFNSNLVRRSSLFPSTLILFGEKWI